MNKLRVLSLFAGIGGFDLGLERTNGFRAAAFCEIDPFCQRVLANHWPKVPIYDDVRTLSAGRLIADGIAIDCIVGGFPCQDISIAGLRRGIKEGSRSGLWSEFSRLISEIRPKFVIVENVSGLLSGPSEQPGGWFGRVLGDLAEIGYDAEWDSIQASAMGSLHARDRVWLIAYPNTDSVRLQRRWRQPSGTWTEEQFTRLVQVALQSAIPTRSGGGIHDGVPNRSHRLKSLGNAVIPQIPELIGNAILESMAA